MRFILEECSFQLQQGQSSALADLILDFSERIQSCRDCGAGDIGRWSGIYEMEILPGIPLFELLFGAHTHLLDPDLRSLLQDILDRCVDWTNGQAVPADSSMVEVDDTHFDAPTLAYIHTRMGERRALGAVCLSGSLRHGRKDVVHRAVRRPIHLISNEAERLAYLRDVPELEDMSSRQYIDHTVLAFPKLRLADGLHSQFNRFSRTYEEIRPLVTQHLSALNDHFQAIFQSHQGEPFPVQQEFRGRCSIDSSPESPNTRRNKAAMREREVDIDKHTVVCEWHTKLGPDRDRIYFHPGSHTVAEGRLVIGIFHKHLT